MKRFQRALACILMFCMTISVLPVHATAADGNYIYFLNSSKWKNVGAYIYGDNGELLGGWGNTMAEPADEMGGDWTKVEVSELPPFSVIFYSAANDSKRAELYLPDADNIYVTAAGESFTSRESAEKAVYGDDYDPDANYIYFLNSSKWEDVGAYIYGEKGELLGGWGSTVAKSAPELGDDWMKVKVPELPPFNIIFYNTAMGSERAEIYLSAAENIFVTSTAESFTSREDAEAAVQDASTVIYFLNWDGEKNVLDSVYAYAYIIDDIAVSPDWPGIKATEASDLGENWWKVEIQSNASLKPFTVIFSDNGSSQLADIAISNYENNYVTAKANQVYTSQTEAEKSVGIAYETVLYFLNDQDWPIVNAYVYGQPGEALGGWPGTLTTGSELGAKWRQITVPAKLPFNIIFFNANAENDGERIETLLDNENQLYLASTGKYTSQLEAELDTGLADPSLGTTLHFYNYREWNAISGYFYAETGNIGAGWPGKAADPDMDTGENWWTAFVPKDADAEPFYAIFNDGVSQTDDISIADKTNVYITPGGQKFATAAEAEAAAAEETFDDGCEAGPNADITGYNVIYSGAGAALPYVTYEAEAAKTNAEVLPYATEYRESVQSEAGGRQAVKLTDVGDYVEFTLTNTANSLVMRYAMPDSEDGGGINASLSLYVNGAKNQALELTSKYAWVYGGYPYYNTPNSGMAHRFFDETRLLLDDTFPAGTTIRLQKDAGDTADYYVIDFIECEQVAAPLAQPAGSLSVTDFGAVANDGQDDYAAFEAAIAAAKEQGKEVWLPRGTFNLVEKKAIKAEGVTIRGAGMWHTNLFGAGACFQFSGTSKFYDFSMTGVSTVRDDAGDPAGFENSGHNTNVTIQNIWMEHMKVGVWTANTERMAIQGCRIRNTYADGINLCSGTKDSIVRNNSLRNTGDDCIAMWPWLGNETGNTVNHNTIQVPTLANGVAIYGGGDHEVSDNYIADIINNGAGIVVGSEFETPKGFTDTVTVKDNVLYRCGSMQTDENYMVGAIWIWNSLHHAMNSANINIFNNAMYACPQAGITIEHNMDTLEGLNIQNNKINGAKHAVFSYLSGGGSAVISRMTHEGISGDEFVYAETQGAEVKVMNRVDEGGKVFLKGDQSAFLLEIADQKIEGNDPGDVIPGKPDVPIAPTVPSWPSADSSTTKPAPDKNSENNKDSTVDDNSTGKTDVTPDAPSIPMVKFADVEPTAWCYDSLQYVAKRGLMTGTSGNTFSPDAATTRGMLMTALARLSGIDTSTGSTWYQAGMEWAIAKGISDGTAPEGTITRQQMITMLYRFIGSPNAAGSLDGFADVSRIQDWAMEAMVWAVENGIINGIGNGLLDPEGSATRAQMATILARFCQTFNF